MEKAPASQSLERNIFGGFFAAGLLLLVTGSVAWWSAAQSATTFRWVDHTHEVLYRLEATLTTLLSMQSAARGFLLTGEDGFLVRHNDGESTIHSRLQELRTLTADNPSQQVRMARLENTAGIAIRLMREGIDYRRTPGFRPEQQAEALRQSKQAMDEIRELIAAMEDTERSLLHERSIEAQLLARRANGVTLACGLFGLGFVGVTGYIIRRDLRLRRAAEAERDRFFSLSLDMLCIASGDGYFKRVSQAFTDTLGWSIAEMKSRPIMEFVHPEDRAATQREIERQVVAGEKVWQFENRYQHKDGSWRVLSWRSVPYPGGLMYATARDVTERWKYEQMHLQFRALFESLPGLFLVLTPDLNIAAVSDAYLKATMTKRDQILGRHLFDVFPDNPDDPGADGVAKLRASLERVVKNAAPDTMAIQKYDGRRPDGSFEERYWSPVNAPLFGLGRRIEYIVHRVEDVTDFMRTKAGGHDLADRVQQMEAEIYQRSQELSLAIRQLEAANAELESFSYSVSHDLRAPVRHMAGFAALLANHPGAQLDDKGRHFLNTIAKAAEKMGHLIDDLLAFSRLGRAPLALAPVDCQRLVTEIIRDGQLGDARVEWKLSPLPTVSADVNLLRQVWLNLLGNAVKYSRPVPQPVIEISADADATTNETVFSVRDNGVGFDPRYAPKLFNVFSRLHSTSEFDGTGIGLALVRRIVGRHGGRTWAEGRPGQGATFFFSLPNQPVTPSSIL